MVVTPKVRIENNLLVIQRSNCFWVVDFEEAGASVFASLIANSAVLKRLKGLRKFEVGLKSQENWEWK